MYTSRLLGLLGIGCVCLASATCAWAGAATPPAAARRSVVPTFTPVEIPQSVFVIPSNAKDGRNPFFPQSLSAAPVVKPKDGSSIDLSGFVLNGITSPPRRTAMINGRTFEPGEEGEIRLPSGAKVMIKCEEIRADSTVIQVNGTRRELRLRFGL
jgi:hypothetical protein